MIAQLLLTAFLALVLVYAWSVHRTVPIIGLLASGAALAGLYFVWVPEHANALAAFARIGRGSDLIVYTWVVISLLIMLNLHLKLRLQLDMITRLARAVAIDRAKESRRRGRPPPKTSRGHVGPKGRGAPDRIAGEEVDAITKSRRDLASLAEPAAIGVDLGERAAKSRDLINPYSRRAVGTRPALGGDQVVGLVQFGFGNPVATEHHTGQLLAPAQADQHARWIALRTGLRRQFDPSRRRSARAPPCSNSRGQNRP